MFDGDVQLGDAGFQSQPPSFQHYFWYCVAAIVIFVVVQEIWF